MVKEFQKRKEKKWGREKKRKANERDS